MALISRAGRYVKQATGYRAFVPAPLPPEPRVEVDAAVLGLLSRADQALGRLDGVTQTLPNPDLFVAMYVRQEAVLSSQIEGAQSTLDDVLEFELDAHGRALPQDVEEVVNYVRAMNHGLRRLTDLPLSLRLLREIHAELLRGVRGSDRQPGEFRSLQNWIGEANAPLARASYIPPPMFEMNQALDNFEKFLHDEAGYPVLVQCGLAHAQFETIHPFLDGNGRVGRLLITFLLVHRSVLQRPLLYLSHYLKRHRAEYYDRLTAIREDGDWEGWLKFFLRGVAETAEEATRTARAIVDLRETHRNLVQERGLAVNGLRLLDLLFQQPLLSVKLASERLRLSFATANKLVEHLEALDLLHEITGAQRNRRFRYTPYLDLFEERGVAEEESAPVQTRRAIAEQDRVLLDRIGSAIREIEPGARTILHGSRARGDAEPDSDWDLLVLVDGPVDHKRAAAVRRRLYELELETDTVLSAIVESTQDWESPLFRAMPFHSNVAREGVEL